MGNYRRIGFVISAYLVGAVASAFLFGYVTDRFGRKKLFMVTLGLYLTATAATALSWDFASFALFRALTGAGIGGEYAAINAAIQELLPARYRGRTDLAINGSFWIGAALGAVGATVFLKPGEPSRQRWEGEGRPAGFHHAYTHIPEPCRSLRRARKAGSAPFPAGFTASPAISLSTRRAASIAPW